MHAEPRVRTVFDQNTSPQEKLRTPSGLQAWAKHRIARDLAARPTAQFMRDPWGATGHYLDTHNDLEIAADAGLAAMAIIPGGKAVRGAGYAAKTARTLTREEAAVRKPPKWNPLSSPRASEIQYLFDYRARRKADYYAATRTLRRQLPKGHTIGQYQSGTYEETIKQLKEQGYDPQAIKKLKQITKQRLNAQKDWYAATTRAGETGGEAYLESQRYYIPNEFLSKNVPVNNGTAPRGWLDGMAISPDGDEIVISEYKGGTSRLSSTPRQTIYEGTARQGTPAYTRDRMLSDPRFAQYFHDHPDVWEGVKSGQTRLTIKVMRTKTPELTRITEQPFTLTPEVIRHLQQNIDKL